eukprot:UN03508
MRLKYGVYTFDSATSGLNNYTFYIFDQLETYNLDINYHEILDKIDAEMMHVHIIIEDCKRLVNVAITILPPNVRLHVDIEDLSRCPILEYVYFYTNELVWRRKPKVEEFESVKVVIIAMLSEVSISDSTNGNISLSIPDFPIDHVCVQDLGTLYVR